MLPVALWFVHIHRQPDGWALFAGNQRPIAFLTPPTRPRLYPEVTAHQEQDDGEYEDADEPKNWISSVEHCQNISRYCVNSCMLNAIGKGRPDLTNCPISREVGSRFAN
jgi:hypothetical protein